LAPRLARSGLSNVYTMAIDDQTDPRLDRLAGKMDRVLVDAPCSGLGTLRRHPDLKWRVRDPDIAAMAQRQAAILVAASRLVKPRGVLVYATCSLLDNENRAVVRQFLAANPRFRQDDVSPSIDRLGEASAGLVQDGALHLLPHLHDTDGFFATTLRRED
jgi:16S rRNA (cytosine967-C5)-methyltransferase